MCVCLWCYMLQLWLDFGCCNALLLRCMALLACKPAQGLWLN